MHLLRLMLPLAGQAMNVKITVTRVGGDGSVLARAVDTSGRQDSGRWTTLAEHAALGMPPRYRPRPGEPVYRIEADEDAADVAERDLQGPLRELAIAVLAEGDG
jgi:hypothetical protein